MAVRGKQDPALFAAGLALIAGLAVLLAFAIVAAHAEDRGQFGDVDPATRAWFKSVKAPSGVPCCDIADGHKVQFKTDSQGNYFVPINTADVDDPWVPVPPGSVVYDAGNPYEEAIVWYVMQGPGVYYIRCFVPVGGV